QLCTTKGRRDSYTIHNRSVNSNQRAAELDETCQDLATLRVEPGGGDALQAELAMPLPAVAERGHQRRERPGDRLRPFEVVLGARTLEAERGVVEAQHVEAEDAADRRRLQVDAGPAAAQVDEVEQHRLAVVDLEVQEDAAEATGELGGGQ